MDPNIPNGGAANALAGSRTSPAEPAGTAASIVHDVLERAAAPDDGGSQSVQPVVTRVPTAPQAPLYQAVHATADAATSLKQSAQEVVQQEQAMLERAAGYVRAKPRQAIAIAFVTGFIVARVLF